MKNERKSYINIISIRYLITAIHKTVLLDHGFHNHAINRLETIHN